jgi:hypothetical protein
VIVWTKTSLFPGLIQCLRKECVIITDQKNQKWGDTKFFLFHDEVLNLYVELICLLLINLQWQFGYRSCFIRNHLQVYIRLVLGYAYIWDSWDFLEDSSAYTATALLYYLVGLLGSSSAATAPCHFMHLLPRYIIVNLVEWPPFMRVSFIKLEEFWFTFYKICYY